MTPTTSTKLDRVVSRYAVHPRVSALRFRIEQPSTGFTWSFGDIDQPYFVASITKLYTVAVVMQLRDENALTLDTPAAEVLGADTMRGLNVHDGHDYGPTITIRELLAQTSGIPDYFEQKRADGTTLLDDILYSDAAWIFDDFIDMARELPSPFPPSTPGRALYSDTNYQLLGRIIETVTSDRVDDAFRKRIFEPLGLPHTWLFGRDTLDRYDQVATVRHGSTPLQIPNTIASSAPDGAVVSTTADQVRFLRAYTDGALFPRHYLAEMTSHWNSVFSRLTPLEYGLGIMRFRLPRWQTITPFPAMLGHSGAFGTVLYHVPDRDLYLAGTVNQMTPRSLPHRLLARLVAQVR